MYVSNTLSRFDVATGKGTMIFGLLKAEQQQPLLYVRAYIYTSSGISDLDSQLGKGLYYI